MADDKTIYPSKVGCADDKLPPDMKSTVSKIPGIAEAMGMGEKCVQTATTAAKSFAASAGVDTPFGSAGAQASGMSIDNAMTSAGCSTIMANVQEVINESMSMRCTMNSSSSTNSVKSTQSGTITIKTVDPSFEIMQLRMLMINNLGDQIAKLTALISSGGKNPQLIQASIVGLNKNLEILNHKGDVSIKDTKIVNKITGDVSVKSTVKGDMQAKLVTSFKTQVKAAAEQKIMSTAGLNALPASVKSLVDSKVTNKQEEISKTINSAVSENTVEVTQQGAINIISTGYIDLSNTEISNDLSSVLAVQSMTSSAMQMASSIAADVVADVSQRSDTETDNKGLDDLAKALGDANAKAIEAGKAKWNPVGGIVIIVILIVAGIAAVTVGPKIMKSLNPFMDPKKQKMAAAAMLLLIILIVAFIFFKK